MSVMAGWAGTRGVEPIQLVCIDNVRATIEFPHTQERVRDGRRWHASAGGVAHARAAPVGRQFSGSLRRPAGALSGLIKIHVVLVQERVGFLEALSELDPGRG
jgi:hypothetical protein